MNFKIIRTIVIDALMFAAVVGGAFFNVSVLEQIVTIIISLLFFAMLLYFFSDDEKSIKFQDTIYKASSGRTYKWFRYYNGLTDLAFIVLLINAQWWWLTFMYVVANYFKYEALLEAQDREKNKSNMA